ncbi:type 1 glutamine amidotransferase [Psychrobacter sp. FDAARGOS_221]|uniref:type 1 glutamine amidotransferase n=1 Tax=Psychrobacter sp. FDAARGOS_221 TaxID=1975705 RepID=UPI000BB58FA1|nr:type 1 glutamine amidotransferase [Psychrobacter sp. FDAARGOS_221]PNK61077.1 type 1 glutamine amidotransferase [Psychrobacter sp. FDAARGOS_221]
MTLRIHALLHNHINILASVEHWIQRNHHQFTTTQFAEALTADNHLPNIDSFDWLIVMGGPMGVYDGDKFAWLSTEKQFITEAINAGKTVIGMCLGAQLLAECLGAKVGKIDIKEIGWTQLTLTNEGANHSLLKSVPKQFTTFHWHGDGFEIPEGATSLATSEHWPNQGFIYQTDKHKQLGNWLMGWQCHFEVTPDSLQTMIEKGKGISEQDIKQYPQSVQSPAHILENTAQFAANNNAYFDTILDNLESSSKDVK